MIPTVPPPPRPLAAAAALAVLLALAGAGQAHETEGPLEEDTTLAYLIGWCMLPTNATAPEHPADAPAAHGGNGGAASGQPMLECTLPAPEETVRTAPPAQREAFYLLHMVHHHLSALEMARAAEEHAERPEVQELARNISRAQGAEIDQMTRWLREWHGLEAPRDLNATRLGGSMHMMHAGIEDTGAAFDSEFLRRMIEHHNEAIATSDALVAAGAPHEEAVALARDISAKQQEENGRMRMLLQQMGAAPTEEPQEARGGEGRGTPAIGAAGAAIALTAAAALLALRRRGRAR